MFSVASTASAQPQTEDPDDAPASWLLSSEVVVSISRSRPQAPPFRQINGIARTASGDIAIATRDPYQVQVFSSAGVLLKAYASAAVDNTPFQNVQLAGRAGDSVAVYNPASASLSLYSAREGLVRVRTVPATKTDRLHPVSRFSNGDMLLQTSLPTLSHNSDGSIRDSLRIGVLRANSDSISIVKAVPAQSNVSLRVWGNLLWIGDHDTNELTLVDKSGKVASQIRVPADSTGSMSFRNFQVSPEGFIWIERSGRGSDSTARWIVMQRSGAVAAQTVMPKNFEPKEVGTDYILGIKHNRDGLETVAMYRIWK